VAVLRGRVMVLVEGGPIVAVDRSGAAAPPHAEVVELDDFTRHTPIIPPPASISSGSDADRSLED